MTHHGYGKLVSSTRDGRIERSNLEWIEVLVDIATLFGNNLTCISGVILFSVLIYQH